MIKVVSLSEMKIVSGGLNVAVNGNAPVVLDDMNIGFDGHKYHCVLIVSSNDTTPAVNPIVPSAPEAVKVDNISAVGSNRSNVSLEK